MGTNDLKAPCTPILDLIADLKSQLADSFKSLGFSLFKVCYLYPDFIQDFLLITEQMEVAAHNETFRPKRRNDM